MKKLLIVVLLAAASLGVYAQAGSMYVAFLPGYASGSGWSSFSTESGWPGSVKADPGFVASVDGSYFFTDRWGFHVGAMFNEGWFKTRFIGYRGYPIEYSFQKRFGIFEVGPEYLLRKMGDGQLYLQANLGFTLGHSYSDAWSVRQGYKFNDSATYGVALGYRRFYGRPGLAIQVAYHRIDAWNTDQFDVRVGWVYRY